MQLPRLIRRRWFVLAWLMLLLGLLGFWAIRPWSSFYLLGLEGRGDETPLIIIRAWFAGARAPLTPTGCLSLFPTFDSLLAGALVTAIVILLVVLSAPSCIDQPGPWFAKDVGELRFTGPRLRVRTMLLLIATVGLILGWEVVARRRWQESEGNLAEARQYAGYEQLARERIKRDEHDLAQVEADQWPYIDKTITPAARAAERAYERDRIRRALSYEYAYVAALGELQRKLKVAANDGRRLNTHDQPWLQRAMEPQDWLYLKKHDQALAGFEELIRRYPDYAKAHAGRADILATCPDARLRDGKAAVVSATRACELTNRRDTAALSTLAAAHAEVGDFAAAVREEQKAQELFAPHNVPAALRWHADRIILYQAGKPYRDPP